MSQYARDYYTNMEKLLNRFWDVTLNTPTAWNIVEKGENAEMTTENNKASYKYTFTFPGIAPDRVSVRLRSDKATIDVLVDNKLQRTITPYMWATTNAVGYHGNPAVTKLSEDSVKVTMEHGLLTVIVTPEPKSSSSESIELPINGKKFLRETTPDELI